MGLYVFLLYGSLLLFNSLLGIDYPYRSNNVPRRTSTSDFDPMCWRWLREYCTFRRFKSLAGSMPFRYRFYFLDEGRGGLAKYSIRTLALGRSNSVFIYNVLMNATGSVLFNLYPRTCDGYPPKYLRVQIQIDPQVDLRRALSPAGKLRVRRFGLPLSQGPLNVLCPTTWIFPSMPNAYGPLHS